MAEEGPPVEAGMALNGAQLDRERFAPGAGAVGIAGTDEDGEDGDLVARFAALEADVAALREQVAALRCE